MKIETDDYCTMEEFMDIIACSKRSAYRIRAKALAAGMDDAYAKFFGKTLVVKAKIAELEKFYEPFGSENRHNAAVQYGHKGGTQKRINREKASRAAKRAAN